MLGLPLASRLLFLLCVPACIAPRDVRSTPSAVARAKPAPAPSVAQAKPEPAAAFPVLGERCAVSSGSKFEPSQVHVAGRAELSEAVGVRFAWSGTALSFRFRGSVFQIELEDSGHNWFGVTLDGAP